MNIKKQHLCIVATIMIGISAFLPYLSASVLGINMSKSLIDGGDGYILLGIAIVAGILACMNKHLPNIILGAVSLGMFFLENSTVSKNMANMNSTSAALARSMLQNGIGYYFLLIGSIALIIFSFLAYNEQRSAQ